MGSQTSQMEQIFFGTQKYQKPQKYFLNMNLSNYTNDALE